MILIPSPPDPKETRTMHTSTPTAPIAPDAQQAAAWLVEKFAHQLGVSAAEVDVNKPFPDFGLDSTEVLVLAGELEHWLGFELSPTAMWYHPTIARLATHIVAGQAAA
jgi:acyl carrier protein